MKYFAVNTRFIINYLCIFTMNPFQFCFIVLLVQTLCGYSYGQRNKKFFRRDYTYLEEFRSFYKVNTIQRTWQEAKKICNLESTNLFYPKDKIEADAVLDLWGQETSSDTIFIGASALFVNGIYETVDGVSISELYTSFGIGEPNNAGGKENCVTLSRNGTMYDDRCDEKYPFICKKMLASLEWNHNCSTPYSGYEYNEVLGKCYKFSLTPMDWHSAYALCKSELSYLTVIDSQTEANHLVRITEQAPKDKVQGDHLRGVIHVGFHNIFDHGWKTIQDVYLADSGYGLWGNYEPNGGDNERCGSMYYTGQLNDLGCFHKCFFVCEHDIDNTIDKRCTGDEHC